MNDAVVNIVQILEHRAKEQPDSPAIISKSQSITFSELFISVQKTAAFIQNKGLKVGDRILVYLPMSIRLYEVLLGIFSSGMTAVFADAWTTKNRLSEITDFLKPVAFWGIPKAHLLRFAHKPIRKIKYHWFPNAGKIFQEPSQHIVHSDLSLPALITLTSGNTGFPKAANRTHEFLLSQHEVLQQTLNLEEGSTDMPTLPIFVLNNLACGVTTVLPDMNFFKVENVEPKRILDQWERHAAQSVTGSPLFFKKMAGYILKHSVNVPFPKKLFLGGAPVFPSLARNLKRAFTDSSITIVYGSTESEPISEISVESFIEAYANSPQKGLLTGKPVSQIELRIIPISQDAVAVDSDDELFHLSQPAYEVGEIVVKGSHVLKSYVNQPEEERKNKIKTDTSVWHRTGDVGYLDDTGNLYLMGRASSVIKWKNNNLFSFPVELLLDELPEIENSALIVINTSLHIAVKAVNILSPKQKKEIYKVIQHRISEYLTDSPKIHWIKSFPMDPRHNSKIDYEKLAQNLKTEAA